MECPKKNNDNGFVSDFQENYESGSRFRLVWSSIVKHPLVGFDKPFSRSEAWLWMLFEARRKPQRKKRIKGKRENNDRYVDIPYASFPASPEFIANAWGWSRGKVRNFLKRLLECGMIETKVVQNLTMITVCSFDAYQNPKPNASLTQAKREPNASLTQAKREPQRQQDNRITGKQDIRGTGKQEKEKTPPPSPPRGDAIPFEKILADLNEKAKKNYRVVENTKKLIRARWKDGFRLEDFEKVHDNMTAKWKRDPKMGQYLRPATLYCASKFEGYLNAEVTLSDLGIVSESTNKAVNTIQEWVNEKRAEGTADDNI